MDNESEFYLFPILRRRRHLAIIIEPRKRRQVGALAQLGERVLCKHEVVGSIPICSTSLVFGSVAQLVRATGSYPVCRRFESALSHHLIRNLDIIGVYFYY